MDYPLSLQVKAGLKRVEEELKTRFLLGRKSFLGRASLSLFQAGGKRLRPALVLSAGLCGSYSLRKLAPAAMAVELIHMASLIHDDVLDKAKSRRGFPTVNSLWGEKAATATGDFLFAQAFILLSFLKSKKVIKIASEAALALSLGELQELKMARETAGPRPGRWPSEILKNYLVKVRNKTAALFAASSELGGVIAGVNEKETKALKNYGKNLGMAFQIEDDILDLLGEEKALGKTPGQDLKEGVMTMPLLLALQEKRGRDLQKIIGSPSIGPAEIKKTLVLLKQTKALEQSQKEARKYAKQALKEAQTISNKEAREDLLNLANFAINRHH